MDQTTDAVKVKKMKTSYSGLAESSGVDGCTVNQSVGRTVNGQGFETNRMAGLQVVGVAHLVVDYRQSSSPDIRGSLLLSGLPLLSSSLLLPSFLHDLFTQPTLCPSVVRTTARYTDIQPFSIACSTERRSHSSYNGAPYRKTAMIKMADAVSVTRASGEG